MTIQSSSPFLQRPGTRMGWWADSLAAAFVVLFIINAAVVVPAAEVPSNDWWRQTWLPF